MVCTPATFEAPSREWEPDYVNLAGTKDIPIIGADPTARSIAIVNLSTSPSTVYLVPKSDSRDVSQGRAWPLAPGEGITLTTAAPIFVTCALSTDTATVKWMVERGTANPGNT